MSTSDQSLRQKAEERLAAQPPPAFINLVPAELPRFVHELQVHQIELEMQNEELRRAQQELEDSRTRYFDLYDFAPVGYLTLNEQNLILEANLTAATLLGLAKTSLVRQALTRFILPDDEDLFYLYRRQLLKTIEPQACELRLRRAGGTSIWVRLDGIVARDAAPEGLVCWVTITDISERKRVEEALGECELNCRRLIETAEEGIWVVDREWKTSFANTHLEQLFGCPPGGLIGRQIEEFMDDAGRAAAALLKADRERGIRTTHEFRFVRQDGATFWALVATSPIISSHGEFHGAVAMLTDITERKQAEEALRESKERFELSMEATQDGLWDWTIATDAAYYSPAYYGMLGYEPGSLPAVGKTWKDLLHPAERERALQGIAACIDGRCDSFAIEFRMKARDGSWRWILGRGKCVSRDVQGRAIRLVGTHVDLTGRKQAEEELRLLSRRLLEVQDAERRRLARELHDSTAQKIAGLIMSLGRAEDAAGSGDTPLRRELAQAQILAQDCARELRSVSHLLHPPLLEELGLEVALDTYIAGFTRRSGIRVEMDLPAKLARFSADQEMTLFRIVQESLGNILRHSGSRQAVVQLTRVTGRVVLEVRDQGKGISDEQLKRLREHASACGVGISGMQERLRQLGGELEIDSSPAGTTVRAIVPVG